MVPPGHRQTVRDGQPVPVHLEICGMTDIQSREVNKRHNNNVTDKKKKKKSTQAYVLLL